MTLKEMIRAFDRLLDIVNGMSAALKIFCFMNLKLFREAKVLIPQSILIEELKHQVNSTGWEVVNCFEITNIKGKQQFNVYAKDSFHDPLKLKFHLIRTALFTEKYTGKYDRIFISLDSKYGKFKTGYAAFDANKIRKLLEENEKDILKYRPIIEDDLIFFVPRFKFPKLIYVLGNFIISANAVFPKYWNEFLEKYYIKSFIIRDTKSHSKSNYSVLERASVVLNPTVLNNQLDPLIRYSAERILKRTRKFARKNASLFSKIQLFPIKYQKVFVYEDDMRKRTLRGHGLGENLIAIIYKNNTKKIKTPQPVGIEEDFGKYKIIWNKNRKDSGS